MSDANTPAGLNIDPLRQLPAEWAAIRSRAADRWVNHIRRAVVTAQFLTQFASVASGAVAASEILTNAFLEDEPAVIEEINQYVHALYEGPLKTAQERLDTARRR